MSTDVTGVSLIIPATPDIVGSVSLDDSRDFCQLPRLNSITPSMFMT